MPSTKLTRSVVEGYPLPSKSQRVELRDTSVTNFVCRIGYSGKRTYLVSYRNVEGRQRKYKLGLHGQITVDQARKKALEVLASVGRGEDPAAERTRRRHEVAVSPLFSEVTVGFPRNSGHFLLIVHAVTRPPSASCSNSMGLA